MAFKFDKQLIPEVILIETDRHEDGRGFFKELYKQSVFVTRESLGGFVQVNYSYSKKGVLRGLHYQKKPEDQRKLVMVNRGKIFDVAVDIRKGSASFGKWIGVEMAADDDRMIYIPSGFAHGFCVLSEEASIQYFCTKEYSPDHERGIIWDDPDIGIDWPIRDPELSEKDSGFPGLSGADNNF